jgi:hypothetical protein
MWSVSVIALAQDSSSASPRESPASNRFAGLQFRSVWSKRYGVLKRSLQTYNPRFNASGSGL